MLIGTDVCKNQYGIAEGLFDCIYRVPAYNEDGYEATFKEICARHEVDAAIINHDLETMFWCEREPPVSMLLPPARFCAIAGSKAHLYESLRSHDLVPRFRLRHRRELLKTLSLGDMKYPVWIRDSAVGSAGGRGALLLEHADDLAAWVRLNRETDTFMVSEYLPGRNFACELLYVSGRVVKHGSYERLEYFLGKMIPSGVSGNISRGRLLNDERLVRNATAAVSIVAESVHEVMSGFVVVDMREDARGNPLITEINLRHVACTSAFAQAGHNLAEAHLLATLGRNAELGQVSMDYPPDNLILRDIDGPPMWVRALPAPAIGALAAAAK